MEQNNVSFQNVKTGEPLSQKEIDEMFMRRCLQLAKNGRENAKPNRRRLSCKMRRRAC